MNQRLLALLAAGMIFLAAGTGHAQTTQPADATTIQGTAIGSEAGAGAGTGTAESPAPGSTEEVTVVEEEPIEEEPGGLGGLFSNYGIFIMLGGIILLYMWMGRSRRKKEAQRREMLESIQKGDKVTSIGGIVGTVMEVREDEVAVKVDENNNVRMRFARWAIRGVGESAKAENPEQAEKQQN